MADEPTPTGAEIQDPAPTDGAAKSGAAKAFTQDQVNALIEQRLARAEKSFEKKLEDAQASAVAAFREERGLTDDVLSKVGTVDTEKIALKGEVKQLKGKLTSLEGRHSTTSERLHTLLVDEAIVKIAAPKAAGGDVEPILALLRPRMRVNEEDWSTVVLDEKGEPSGMSVEDLVSDLLTRKPQLAAAAGHYGSGSPPRPPGGQRAEPGDSQDRRMAILRKAGFGG